jgi:hypothetical protein
MTTAFIVASPRNNDIIPSEKRLETDAHEGACQDHLNSESV